MVNAAYLEMHPLDTADLTKQIQSQVCPEGIEITDNGIIPLKERVADRHYDPVLWLLRKIRGWIKSL